MNIFWDFFLLAIWLTSTLDFISCHFFIWWATRLCRQRIHYTVVATASTNWNVHLQPAAGTLMRPKTLGWLIRGSQLKGACINTAIQNFSIIHLGVDATHTHLYTWSPCWVLSPAPGLGQRIVHSCSPTSLIKIRQFHSQWHSFIP